MYKIIVYLVIIIIFLLTFYLYVLNKKTESFVNEKPPFPIDVVYTWAGEKNSSNERLSYNNELKYSIRSVFKNASWVNRIFILMNPPRRIPSWFNSEYSRKITVLDHYSTFHRKHLPSTNSNAIETTIVNIPGLSEHFIYMNDDFFISKPVSYLNFFTRDGKIVIDKQKISYCGSMHSSSKKKILNFNLPEYCGMSRHIPLPNKKSVIKRFHNQYTDYIEWVRNIKGRKGIGKDICYQNNLEAWCQQQHNPIAKYAYNIGEAVTKHFSNNDIVFIWEHHDNNSKFNQIKNNSPLFFCINDKIFKNKEEKKMIYKDINIFLDNFYKEKPFFEK
jgi:hypothetical protein